MTQEELISTIIGKTIGLYPNELINILTKNGVVVDADNLDVNKLIVATFNGINTNPTFKSELASFIDSKNIYVESSPFSNAAGDYISGATSLFGSVTSYLGSKDQLKAAQTSANATLASNQTALEIAKLNQQTILTQAQIEANKNLKPSSNTVLYLGLGVGGVMIIGLVVFLITRKK
jgi:hypothetical protein